MVAVGAAALSLPTASLSAAYQSHVAAAATQHWLDIGGAVSDSGLLVAHRPRRQVQRGAGAAATAAAIAVAEETTCAACTFERNNGRVVHQPF